MSAVQPLPHPHRLTVDKYYRMAATGILPAGARVELIEGEIIDMAPIGSRHAGPVNRLNQILQRAAGDHAIVSIQLPVRLDETSEPQPDIALLHPRDDFYTQSHPGAKDVLLLIEVADTTLSYDRTTKATLYARYGIAEYWIVDVPGRQLLRHLNPKNAAYANVAPLTDLAAVTPSLLPGITLDLRPLFRA